MVKKMSGPTVNLNQLTFTDLSKDKYGSFTSSENMDNFLATAAGKANLAVLKNEWKERTNREPTETQIRTSFRAEQANQTYTPGHKAGASTLEIIRKANELDDSGILDTLSSLASKFSKAMDGITEDLGNTLAKAAEIGVKHNSGILGRVADNLIYRQLDTDEEINTLTNNDAPKM